MKKTITIISLLAFLVLGCKPEQKPVDPDTPDIENPEPEPEPEPEPDKPVYADVTLHSAFTEEFAGKTSETFEFSYRQDKDDFRYYPGFPSWNESGTTELMLRIDPNDGVGILNGPLVQTKDYTFYGSYSMRVRMPDAKAVQSNVGVNVLLSTYEDDKTNGYSSIEMMMKLADLSMVYATTQIGIGATLKKETNVVKNLGSAIKATTSFVTIGFDWHTDKVEWWYKSGSNKTVIHTNTTCVPTFPARFRLSYHHSKNNPVESNSGATQAPYYPFELEVDKMIYEPYEDEIKAWHDEYFTK